MKYRLSVLLLIPIIWVQTACHNKKPNTANNFTDDPVFLQVFEFQHNADAAGLLHLLDTAQNLSASQKAFSIQALGNVRDTAALPFLYQNLHQPDSLLRSRTLFALGQLGDAVSTDSLKSAFAKEKNSYIRAQILETIGKTGNINDEQFLGNLQFSGEQPVLLHGQILGLAKLAEKGFASYRLLPGLSALLMSVQTADSTKFWISYYMYRAEMEISDFEAEFITVFNQVKSLHTKDNILKLMQFTQNDIICRFLLKTVQNPDNDYRLTVSALRSLSHQSCKNLDFEVLDLLAANHPHKAQAAAEYLYTTADASLSDTLLAKAGDVSDFRVSSVLYAAALRRSEHKDSVSVLIRKRLDKAGSVYEEAAYLDALKEYPGNYKQMESAVQSGRHPLLRSTGMAALNYIRLSEGFRAFYGQSDKDLDHEFARIYKDAILSGDPALMALSAEMLYNPAFKARELYENTFFVKQALSACNLPMDIEAYIMLRKLDNYLNGTDESFDLKQSYYAQINADSLKKINANQRVLIRTEKGDIIVQLFVNKAPATVTRFVELIKSGYYDGKYLHRVVPGFVVQSGCSRGDGWGSLSQLLRTETTPQHFNEGSLGMASAGKDTESAQWFITLNRTPHLDGRYTLFGKVIKGMDVVHQLQMGDRVIKMELSQATN